MAHGTHSSLQMIYEEIEHFALDENPDLQRALSSLRDGGFTRDQLLRVWELVFHILYAMHKG
jgi:hypothetical protein